MNSTLLAQDMPVNHSQRVQLSQINIRANWQDLPQLAERLKCFLEKHQPTALIISQGIAKQGETKMLLNAEHTLEGFLLVVDAHTDLHGSDVERFVESLVVANLVKDYIIASIPLRLIVTEGNENQ